MTNIFKLASCFILLAAGGCANDPSLGVSLHQLQAEQSLNPDAWYENLDYLPEGSGQRTQTSLEVYNNNGATQK